MRVDEQRSAEPFGMPADSLAERNCHLEHCRNRVNTWCMRDVLDFLGEHYIDQHDYCGRCIGTEDFARVDRLNRERAALWLAGRPVPMIGTPEERLARALPTLTTASPAQHANAAARIVADMDAEGDIVRRPKIGNVY